jgi:hypothetical protein
MMRGVRVAFWSIYGLGVLALATLRFATGLGIWKNHPPLSDAAGIAFLVLCVVGWIAGYFVFPGR